MARNPVCVSKRIIGKKNQFRYYIRIWDEERGKYKSARSAASVALILNLDEARFPATSRTGAFRIGLELLKRGGALAKQGDPLLADYCAEIWDWDKSAYIQGKRARGLRIGKQHSAACAAYVRNYIKPAFPALKLSTLKPYHIEKFILDLKKAGKLSNRSINAVFDTLNTPLKEAVRLGLIPANPAASVRKLGMTKREKGIPKEAEIAALLALRGLDHRLRVAVMLGAVCGLRLGEIQALKLENIEGDTLRVIHSWSKFDGIKETKTGRDRIVPLPLIVAEEMRSLAKENIHGETGFLMYGVRPDAPLDNRALERKYDEALTRLTLRDNYAAATSEEKIKAIQSWKARNVTFHSLRHFANSQLRGAVPDETLRKLTGHTTEEMTNHYDHTTEADLKALAAAQETRILPFIKIA